MSEYKRLTENEVERLLSLYIKGCSLRRVAREMKCNQSTVTWHVKRAGIPVRSRESYFGPKPLTQEGRKRRV